MLFALLLSGRGVTSGIKAMTGERQSDIRKLKNDHGHHHAEVLVRGMKKKAIAESGRPKAIQDTFTEARIRMIGQDTDQWLKDDAEEVIDRHDVPISIVDRYSVLRIGNERLRLPAREKETISKVRFTISHSQAARRSMASSGFRIISGDKASTEMCPEDRRSRCESRCRFLCRRVRDPDIARHCKTDEEQLHRVFSHIPTVDKAILKRGSRFCHRHLFPRTV